VQRSPVRNDLEPDTRSLARQLVGFLRFTTIAGGGDFLRAVSELELSLTQLKAISLLDESGEPLAVKDLADRLGLSVAATSRAVDGLFKRGLVDRDEDLVDRRVRRVRLTGAGRRTMETLLAIRIVGLDTVLKGLSSSERRKLAVALDAILEHEEIRRFCPRRKVSR
jgi:DNA-binding MarR family transcriptional regulator